jgi:hypothetical protein
MAIKQLRHFELKGKTYFVDIRLSEFRSSDMLEIIPFKSEKGDNILSDLILKDFFTNAELGELRL